jgi:hypothetical protein
LAQIEISSQIHSPLLGGQIQLWHRIIVAARKAIHTQAGGPVRKPYTGVNYIPQSGTMNTAAGNHLYQYRRARICKRLCSPGIDSEESFSPTYGA